MSHHYLRAKRDEKVPMTIRSLTLAVEGTHTPCWSGRTSEVFHPDTGPLHAQVPPASKSEANHAITVPQAARREWTAGNPQRRARVLLRFPYLVDGNFDDLARLRSSEHGKIITDGRGGIQRGIEAVEIETHCCSAMLFRFFTRAGSAARDFASGANVGMVGVNVRIPLPVAQHAFGGGSGAVCAI